ncbi:MULTISPECIES: LysR family transcriptional regulator [unclassified Streptomyces]|uniref:LysR family transcriptional regulator n=1 Tax=unclassified Streptomyces TaxID=2593676 RepID=UPI000A401542|nr:MULTISPECIES: LysR family transcriptional regulator [unclassified Streptomyces]
MGHVAMAERAERVELEAFLTLAEELHFGRTAERMHLTTGRISQTLRKLERRIGTPLFERSSRHVRLTPAGRQLHEDLLPAYRALEAGLRKAANAARGVEDVLRVGYVGPAVAQLTLHASHLYADRFPGCRIQPREVQIADGFPRLRDGDVDVLIVTLPHQEPGMVNGPVLFSERRMLAVPAQHPLARRDTVSLEDLAAVRLLQVARTLPDYWRTERTPPLTPSGTPIGTGPTFDTLQEALSLIGAGQGAFVVGAQVTRYYARPDVTYIPFDDAPPLEWVPTWLASTPATTIHAFNRTAREAAGLLHLSTINADFGG